MKLALSKYGLGTVAVMSMVAAAVVGISTSKDSHAAISQDWHRVDKANLFFHDLTSGPATLVAALEVGADGSVSSRLAPLHELQYWRSNQNIVAARSKTATDLDVQTDGKILFNATDGPVMAYFEVADGMREILLRPHEGVAIGEMSQIAGTQTVRGCKCVCTGVHPTLGPVMGVQYIPCSQVVPNYEPGTACDCSSIEGDGCWFDGLEHPELDGAYQGCKNGFVPTGTGNSN